MKTSNVLREGIMKGLGQEDVFAKCKELPPERMWLPARLVAIEENDKRTHIRLRFKLDGGKCDGDEVTLRSVAQVTHFNLLGSILRNLFEIEEMKGSLNYDLETLIGMSVEVLVRHKRNTSVYATVIEVRRAPRYALKPHGDVVAERAVELLKRWWAWECSGKRDLTEAGVIHRSVAAWSKLLSFGKDER